MAQAQPESERILEGDTLKGIEREYRDLVLSLKALAALLREEPGEDHVLPRLLEAELNQLSILVGEVCAALKVEDRGPRIRGIDLAQAMRHATHRAGVRAALVPGEAVPVEADPEIASQAIQSALALAVRVADGAVSVRARRTPDGGGEVVISASAEFRPARARDPRIHLLRKLLVSEGARLTVRKHGPGFEMRLWFPPRLV